MSANINVSIDINNGKTAKLLTAGKYCDRDILLTVEGYTGEELDAKYQDGYGVGYQDGEDAGYTAGHQDGENVGYTAGYQNGEDAGYTQGKADAENELLDYENDKVTTLEQFTFYKSKLRRISLPNVTSSVDGSVFTCCPNLEELYLPNYTGSKTGHFCEYSPNLRVVDLGYATSIGSKAFQGCFSLKALVLRSPDVIHIQDLEIFDDCPLGEVSVYVPEHLITDYQDDGDLGYYSATNWDFLTDPYSLEYEITKNYVTLVPLEGSEYE